MVGVAGQVTASEPNALVHVVKAEREVWRCADGINVQTRVYLSGREITSGLAKEIMYKNIIGICGV